MAISTLPALMIASTVSPSTNLSSSADSLAMIETTSIPSALSTVTSATARAGRVPLPRKVLRALLFA